MSDIFTKIADANDVDADCVVNWSKPSLAVCASDGDDGWVIFHAGPHVGTQIDAVGTRQLEDLGLAAPAGISIWEGKIKGGERTYEGDYNDTYLAGTLRAPTDDEWAAIRAGRSPWSEDDWLMPAAVKS